MPTTKSNNVPSTHAGGVVYRWQDEAPELLLVTARIIEFLATSRQVIRGAPQHIDYYLLERVAEEKASEGRRIAWLRADSVLRRITYDEQRAVLKQACARLAQTKGIS